MPTTRTTYREVFEVREFGVLFGAKALAITGETMRIVVLSVLVYAETGSELLGALAYGVGFAPQVVGGAFLTSLADRLRPRAVIAAGYSVGAGSLVLLAVVPMPPAAMLAAVAVVACLTPVFAAASSGLLPSLLAGDRYVLGRSLYTMSSAVAQIAGLGAGGLVLTAVSPRAGLLVAAAAQLVAAAVVRVGLADHPPRTDERRAVVRASLAGNGQLLADRAVRRLLLIQWLPPALLTAAESVLVPYVTRVDAPAAAAAYLLAVIPVGMLVGDLVVGRFLRPVVREWLVLPLLVLTGVTLLPFAVVRDLRVAAVLLTLAGIGCAYLLGVQRAFVDAVPVHQRGVGFGLVGTGLMTGQGLGPVASGALAGAVGAGGAISVAGGATLLTALWWSLSRTGGPDLR